MATKSTHRKFGFIHVMRFRAIVSARERVEIWLSTLMRFLVNNKIIFSIHQLGSIYALCNLKHERSFIVVICDVT